MNSTVVTQSNNARRLSAALLFLTGMAVAALGALMLLAAFPPVPHVTAYASASSAAVIASLPAAALPVILLQETAWTPAPGVTAAMDVAVYVEGDSSLCLTIGKDFTGGLIAAAETSAASEPYRTGELSFWIKADVPAAFGGLEIVAGSENYNLSAGDLDGAWHQVNITLPADGLRGSVALYATENPGAARIWLDGMEIKASGNAPYYSDTLPKQLVNAFSEEAHYT